MSTERDEKLARCRGCDNDFYNGQNAFGVRECWNLKTARKVVRYKIGWWDQPTSSSAFVRVDTNDCHTESGRYEFRREENVPTEFLRQLKRRPVTPV